MNKFLPLMLELTEKKVVIFGGGDVGERKALFFFESAKVCVISREFSPILKELFEAGKIERIYVSKLEDKEIKEYLKDAFIVIPATSDEELNNRISDIATQYGIFINRVDEIGNVIIPSIIKHGDIVIGISTLGKSPAISKYIRKKIEEVIKPEFSLMSKLQDEIRQVLKKEIKDQKKRKQILWNILNDDEVWTELGNSYEKAYDIAFKKIGNKND